MIVPQRAGALDLATIVTTVALSHNRPLTKLRHLEMVAGAKHFERTVTPGNQSAIGEGRDAVTVNALRKGVTAQFLLKLGGK
ncbi:MAG TPA: hypothetical protein VNF70_02805, partial [Pyrinomonadaceae bacterium]|nr:hypothetical protein [Pyrinomonadaceae bacterium]